MIHTIVILLMEVIQLYYWTLIIAAVFSMLTQFGVLDTRNRIVWSINDFLYRVTEPVLRPVRRYVPSLGGLDLSFLVVILILQAMLMLLPRLEMALETGSAQPLIY